MNSPDHGLPSFYWVENSVKTQFNWNYVHVKEWKVGFEHYHTLAEERGALCLRGATYGTNTSIMNILKDLGVLVLRELALQASAV
jgi:hypothetical protein